MSEPCGGASGPREYDNNMMMKRKQTTTGERRKKGAAWELLCVVKCAQRDLYKKTEEFRERNGNKQRPLEKDKVAYSYEMTP